MQAVALGEYCVAKRRKSAREGNPGETFAFGKGVAFDGGDVGGYVESYNASAAAESGEAAVPAPAAAGTVTPQMAAAVSAVIAEEMGTDVSGLRIVSFKKINS